jgi:protein SCO1/2
MNQKQAKFPNIIWVIGALIILFGITAVFVIEWANVSRGNIPVYGTLPEFEFTERSGEPFGLNEMRGKINVVDFFFSNCHGPCPIMNGNIRELYDLYESSDRIQFVSISVDPARDTLLRLQEYAKEMGVVDFRWVFLRAPIDSVADLMENGFMLAAEDLPGGHTTQFVLVDNLGRIRGYYSGIDDAEVELLKEHIRIIGRELP